MMRSLFRSLLFSLLLIPTLTACGVTLPLEPLLFLQSASSSAQMPPQSAYADLPQSLDEDGQPILGDPDAPVQVTLFTNLACSSCAGFNAQVVPALLERVAAGDISLRVVLLTSYRSLEAQRPTAFAWCLAEQGGFWQYVDSHFADFRERGDDVLTAERARERYERILMTLDLEPTEDTVTQCLADVNDSDYDRASDIARALGAMSTPTVVINETVLNDRSVDGLNAAIDTALGR